MLGNKPDIRTPQWIERKSMIINILKRKLLNQITRNLKWVNLNDIDENITQLHSLEPEEIMSRLHILIEENFGKIKSVKKRNKIVWDLMSVFSLSCQEIESEDYQTDETISPDQEANKVTRKVRNILDL